MKPLEARFRANDTRRGSSMPSAFTPGARSSAPSVRVLGV